MRKIWCFLLVLIAMFFGLIGTTMIFTLPSQAAKDRVYYEQFRTAAAYINKTGTLPSDGVLRKLESAVAGPSIWNSLNAETPFDCDPSFKKAKEDRLIMSFWRGEWSECYAYPSGRTTLVMSVPAYLLKGAGIELAIYWFIAAAAIRGAIRVRPRMRASALSIPNGS